MLTEAHEASINSHLVAPAALSPTPDIAAMDCPIPKKLHMIWIGNEAARPDAWIETWRRNHHDWEFRLWGNHDLHKRKWINGRHIRRLIRKGHFAGAADLMRYEILFEHGGIYVDADSVSERPLDDYLRSHRAFAIWESETAKPGLIANGFMGCTPRHPLMRRCINRLWWTPKIDKSFSLARLRWQHKEIWTRSGPEFLTQQIHAFGIDQVHILPSCAFLPEHWTGEKAEKDGPIYARHMWGTTKGLYAPLPH